jgi:site-specific recombinase XerC
VNAYVIPHIGSMKLEAISPGDLIALYRDLLAGGGRNGRALAPKTVRHVHTTLRKALGDAVEARHIAFNPAASAKAPKVARGTEPAAWTAEQLARFLAAISDERPWCSPTRSGAPSTPRRSRRRSGER